LSAIPNLPNSLIQTRLIHFLFAKTYVLTMFSWTLNDYRMNSGVRGMLVRPDESFFNAAQQAETVQQSVALKDQVNS
jgi:hypothetical protein